MSSNTKGRAVCINCRHGAIGISPSVGGFTSGVSCHSKLFSEYLDSQVGNDGEFIKEFKENGFLSLFRLECVEDDTESCPMFEDRIHVDEPNELSSGEEPKPNPKMEDPALAKILEDAQNAFWKVIAERFPEIHTGDFPPDATLKLDEACEEALLIWLYANAPVQIIPTYEDIQVTICPICGAEYNLETTYQDDDYEPINLVMDIYRHKKCGAIVRFDGGV